jgi:hypothetical protein
MDRATKHRLEKLEARVNSKTPVLNIKVVFVDPPKWVEDDDETRKQRERTNDQPDHARNANGRA